MYNSQEYRAIEEVYGSRTAKISKVLLIRHIQEGLIILERINASEEAKKAFCLYPLLQSNDNLSLSLDSQKVFSTYLFDVNAVILAMEYRAVANAYLSFHYKGNDDIIYLSHLKDVNDMLIADKIQKRKDFLKYHKDIHKNSDILNQYFINWLKVLNINDYIYDSLVKDI